MRVLEREGKTILVFTEGYELEVRESSIHGYGVFALSEIESGIRVIEYVGERITKAESQRRGTAQLERYGEQGGSGSVYIFDLNKRYDIDGNVPHNYARFINHSCEPNCEAVNHRGRIFYESLRAIAPGEELFIDYGYDLEHWMEHPCRCGTSSCVGYIVNKVERPKLKRLLRKRGGKSLVHPEG